MLPALLASIAALGFCWFCVHRHAPAIQSDIQQRTGQALQAAGLSLPDLSAEGRDVLIKGVRPEASAKVREIAEGVWGVRQVRIEELATPPPPAPVVSDVQNKLNEIVRLKNIEFRSGSAELTPQGLATLDEVAAALTGASSLTVSISGHTDASGDAAANQQLSEARAAAVKTYLASKGVDAARMTTAGFGQTKPVADNATPAGRKKNRRIEFGVTGGGQATVVPAR